MQHGGKALRKGKERIQYKRCGPEERREECSLMEEEGTEEG